MAERRVAERRGRPLMAWALLLASWVIMRAVFQGGPPEPYSTASQRPAGFELPQAAAARRMEDTEIVETRAGDTVRSLHLAVGRYAGATASIWPFTRQSMMTPLQVHDSKIPQPVGAKPTAMSVRSESQENRGVRSFGVLGIAADSLSIAPVTPLRKPDKRFGLYGYSFWRLGSRFTRGLATAAQYGGSQSGIIATYRVNKGNKTRLSLLARAAISPANRNDREIAIGLRWQPGNRFPITLSAERRFRQSARDATAIYVAGSVDKLPLAAKFRLSGFAQGGLVSTGSLSKHRSTPFLDAGLRAERDVATLHPAKFAIGAGAWAGGQRGTRRLDFGPTLSADIGIAKTNLRLNADWRFRVAGNASPGDGPTLTISTGF